MSFMKKAHQEWKGNFPQLDLSGKIWVKSLGSNISKVSLGLERGFKILPENDAKMLSHNM
jgi:hypothetical protein